ncbi:MAG: ABC transporter ATP-binding protein, partial [bacterium]
MSDATMLRIERLDAFYGAGQALREVSLEVAAGETLCLFGRNGAGKSTLLKAVMGLVRARGSVCLDGRETTHLPAHAVARLGLGYVPQGRRLFAEMTLDENLEIGLMARRKTADAATRDAIKARILSRFPPLAPRRGQIAGTLSGGEQQML